jgi:hypothetical protein
MRIQAALALLLTTLLLRPPLTYSQQPAQPAKPAPAKPAAAKAPGATTPATKDIGWPRQITKDGATLIYYQPQIDEWKDYKEITADVAFSLKTANGQQSMGVASIKAGTLVDKNARTVFIRDITVTSVRFPGLEESAKASMEFAFKSLVPTGGEPLSLDRLMADVDRSKVTAKPVALKNDPPQIFFSSSPAVLLIVEGDPVIAPIEKNDMQFVVNSNWDLFTDKDKEKYYLLATDGVWLTASDLKGPWKKVDKLPKDMSKLPDNQNWDDVKKAMPPRTTGVVVPQVFFASQPAEMILLKGGPIYARIPGTQLLYVTNTDSDLFVDSKDNMYYVLISGRWFRGKGVNGPWSYAGNDLPADFAKIPANSPKADVLASVPGTIEAADAVMLAQIPTTAMLKKSDVESKVKVSYDGGMAQFKPIEGTSLQYATNTQDKVIQVGDEYYVCYNAVWLVSKDPNGPWKVADSIPKEIYNIPASSPVHNVTYVTQTTSGDSVESSSTAGYLGMMMIGTAVGFSIAYGTGYYYPPYYYYPPGMYYPVYRPYPTTYGAGAVYNPATGGYAVGRAAYGPYGAVGSAAWYNPQTGRYGRSASAQSWYGGRTVASAYNPRTGAYGATSQGHNAYSQWGQSAAVRGDQWARSGHITTENGTVGGIRSSEGNAAFARGENGSISKGPNNTYASKDGNVYRKDSSGNWSQYNDGNWNPVDSGKVDQAKQQAQQKAQERQANGQGLQNRANNSTQTGAVTRSGDRPAVSSQTMEGLNRSSAARDRGTTQMERNSGGFGGGGFGGGGFRGGGGGRRR